MKKSVIISTLILIFTLVTSHTAAASGFWSFFNSHKHNKHHNKKDRFCKVLEKRIAKLTKEEERIQAKLDRLEMKFEEKCEVPPAVTCPCNDDELNPGSEALWLTVATTMQVVAGCASPPIIVRDTDDRVALNFPHETGSNTSWLVSTLNPEPGDLYLCTVHDINTTAVLTSTFNDEMQYNECTAQVKAVCPNLF